MNSRLMKTPSRVCRSWPGLKSARDANGTNNDEPGPYYADLEAKTVGVARRLIVDRLTPSMIDEHAENGRYQYRIEHDVDCFKCVAVPHRNSTSLTTTALKPRTFTGSKFSVLL
jgi:hypothetical protein